MSIYCTNVCDYSCIFGVRDFSYLNKGKQVRIFTNNFFKYFFIGFLKQSSIFAHLKAKKNIRIEGQDIGLQAVAYIQSLLWKCIKEPLPFFSMFLGTKLMRTFSPLNKPNDNN